MPLHQLFQTIVADSPIACAIWHIPPSASEADLQLESLGSLPMLLPIKHPRKRLESLAARLAHQAAAATLQLPAHATLFKGIYGEPYRSDGQAYVSLSHAFPFAAAIVNKDKPVGIDLQIPNQKLQHVQQKYLSLRERDAAAQDIEKLCVYWCAKEALYKLVQQPGLSFRAIHLAPFIKKPTGHLKATIGQVSYVVHYQLQKEYVLAWCCAS